jgi:transglutaminase-like putative cysteine protease
MNILAVFPRHFLVASLAAVAGYTSILSWQALTMGFDATARSLAAVAFVVVAVGAVGRTLRWSAWALLPVQITITALLVHVMVTGSGWPSAESLEIFTGALDDAVASARTYTAPIPFEAAPVHPLLVLAGAAVLVTIDFAVGTLRRPASSALVLLAVHAVPVMITRASTPWWAFVVPSVAYLGLLFLHHADRIQRWGRPLDDARSPARMFGPRRTTTAAWLATTSIVAALVASTFLPAHLGIARLKGHEPGGDASDVEVVNPMVDLRRDLSRGQDLRLLRITTPAERPTYVRLSVLTRFDDGRWTPGDRDIPRDQIASGELPALDGVSRNVPRRSYDYTVRAWPDFRSTWLPTTSQVSEIEAGSEWRYDTDTRDFIAVDDATTSGISYRFTGVTLNYDPVAMDLAPSGTREVPAHYTDVPASLSPTLTELATSVTADAPTRFQKARALQEWFRSTGNFRYDLTPAESLGSGTADLLAFLDEETGRVGYCEQFAASMAIMARTLDIPARVAVGFLEPTEVEPGTWEFSAWDMHAWPELYFPGSGWVRFEPTPGARATGTPDYTNTPLPSATPSPTPSPSPTQTTQPAPAPTDRTPDAAQDNDTSASEDREAPLPWRELITGTLVVIMLGGLALTPALVRRRRRQHRRTEGVEGVWSELHDLFVDLGHPWPYGLSPRRTGEAIAERLARPTGLRGRPERPRRGRDEAPEAAAALDRIVTALEEQRYAQTAPARADQALADDLTVVEEALVSGVSAGEQRRATWWPRSVVSRRSTRTIARERDAELTSTSPRSG